MGGGGKIIFGVIVVLLVLISVLGVYFFGGSSESVPFQAVRLDKESLPGYLSQQSVIKDLPDDASFEISFGDTDYRYVNGKLVLSDGSDDSPEVRISFPERYIGRIGEVGLCQAMKEASANNEIGFESSLSATQLTWKYKSLFKYKSCFS